MFKSDLARIFVSSIKPCENGFYQSTSLLNLVFISLDNKRKARTRHSKNKSREISWKALLKWLNLIITIIIIIIIVIIILFSNAGYKDYWQPMRLMWTYN